MSVDEKRLSDTVEIKCIDYLHFLKTEQVNMASNSFLRRQEDDVSAGAAVTFKVTAMFLSQCGQHIVARGAAELSIRTLLTDDALDANLTRGARKGATGVIGRGSSTAASRFANFSINTTSTNDEPRMPAGNAKRMTPRNAMMQVSTLPVAVHATTVPKPTVVKMLVAGHSASNMFLN